MKYNFIFISIIITVLLVLFLIAEAVSLIVKT
jgi:hypothetical protein